MKLLFDENLSPVLPGALADCYAESQHVRGRGPQGVCRRICLGVRSSQSVVIVTKDSDFRHRHGHPPKVIWIALGNCSTRTIDNLLRRRRAEVADFLADKVKAFMVLG